MQCAAETAIASMALMAAVRPSASAKLNVAYDAKTISGTSLLPLGAPCTLILSCSGRQDIGNLDALTLPPSVCCRHCSSSLAGRAPWL